jgi:hypothetical protein
MRRPWTRRHFFEAAAGTLASLRAAASNARPAPASALSRSAETLRAAMDEIIPAADGMPSASASGVARYLEELSNREASVKRALSRAAAALEKSARTKRYVSLEAEGRVRALETLERREPAVFAMMRDLVYQGYYTSPEVWKLLGFEFYGPDRPGPGIAEFDATALERVRARPPFYRRTT